MSVLVAKIGMDLLERRAFLERFGGIWLEMSVAREINLLLISCCLLFPANLHECIAPTLPSVISATLPTSASGFSFSFSMKTEIQKLCFFFADLCLIGKEDIVF